MVSSSPSTLTNPSFTGRKPISVRISVVFPEVSGPITHVTSPSRAMNERRIGRIHSPTLMVASLNSSILDIFGKITK